MSESPKKRRKILKTTSESGETHRKRVKKSSETEKTNNREVLRNKWKLLYAKKVRRARIRNVSDVAKYNRSYIHFYKSKTRMAFKKWKLKFAWRQLFHETLFKYRIDNIHKEAEKTSIDSWERFYIELQREIKTQNIIAAFKEKEDENLLEKCFSLWKNKIYFVNDLHKYYREKWFTLLEGLIDIDKEERQKQCLQAINYYENWKFFSQQLLHNSYIQLLTNAKNTVDLLHNWNYFALQLKLNQIKLIHESYKNSIALRSKWISISNELKYRNQIEVLEYQRNELNKSLKIYILIDKIVKQTRRNTLLETRKELTAKIRRTLLTKSIRKWHIQTSSNRKVTQISRNCFQESLNEYMFGVGTRNATKIAKWYRGISEKRNLNRALLSKCFILWHKFIPRIMDTIFVTPMLNASLKIPEVFSTKIMPIKIKNNFSVCKDVVSYRLKTRVYENNSFLNQNRKEVEKRFNEALKKDGLNVIDRFIPDDVSQIVSGIMKGFDFVYPTETDETKPKKFDITEEFFKVLDNSDFFSDIFSQFSPRARQGLKQGYGNGSENDESSSDGNYVFEEPPDASFSKRDEDTTELKTSKVNLDEFSSTMDLSDQDDFDISFGNQKSISKSVIDERSSSIITDMSSDSGEEDKDEMKKLIDEMTTETPTQETNEGNPINSSENGVIINEEEEIDSNQQTLDFNEKIDKVHNQKSEETIDNDNNNEEDQTIPETVDSSQNKIEEEEDEEDNFDLDFTYNLNDVKDHLNNVEEEFDESIPQTIDSTKDEEIPQTIDNLSEEEEEHQKQIVKEEEDAIIDNVDDYSDEENEKQPITKNIKPIYNDEEDKSDQELDNYEEEDFVIDDNEEKVVSKDNELEEEEEDYIIDEEEPKYKETQAPKIQEDKIEEEEDFAIDSNEEEEPIYKETKVPNVVEEKIEEEEDFAIDSDEEELSNKETEAPKIQYNKIEEEEEDFAIDEEEPINKEIKVPKIQEDKIEEEDFAIDSVDEEPTNNEIKVQNVVEEKIEEEEDFAIDSYEEEPMNKEIEAPKIQTDKIEEEDFAIDSDVERKQEIPVEDITIDNTIDGEDEEEKMIPLSSNAMDLMELEEEEEEHDNSKAVFIPSKQHSSSNDDEEESLDDFAKFMKGGAPQENQSDKEEEKVEIPQIKLPNFIGLFTQFLPKEVSWMVIDTLDLMDTRILGLDENEEIDIDSDGIEENYEAEITERNVDENEEKLEEIKINVPLIEMPGLDEWFTRTYSSLVARIVPRVFWDLQPQYPLDINDEEILDQKVIEISNEEEEEKLEEIEVPEKMEEEESGDEYNDYSYIQTESQKNTIKSNEEESKSSENRKRVTFDLENSRTYDEEFPDENNHFTITLDESFVRDIEEPMIIMQNLLKGTNNDSFLGSNSDTFATTDKSNEKLEEKEEETLDETIDETLEGNETIDETLEGNDTIDEKEISDETIDEKETSDVTIDETLEEKEEKIEIPESFVLSIDATIISIVNDSIQSPLNILSFQALTDEQEERLANPELPTITAEPDTVSDEIVIRKQSTEEKPKVSSDQLNLPPKFFRQEKEFRAERFFRGGVVPETRGLYSNAYSPKICVPIRYAQGLTISKPIEAGIDIKTSDFNTSTTSENQKVKIEKPKKRSPKKKKENETEKAEEQVVSEKVISDFDDNSKPVLITSASLPKPPSLPDINNDEKPNNKFELPQKFFDFFPGIINDAVSSSLSRHLSILYVPLFIESSSDNEKQNSPKDSIPLLGKINGTTNDETIPLLSKKNNETTNDDIPLLSKGNNNFDSIPLLSKRNDDTNESIPLLSKRNPDDDIPLLSKRNNETNDDIPLLSKRNNETNDDIPLLSKRNPNDDIPLLSKGNNNFDSIPLLSKKNNETNDDIPLLSKGNNNFDSIPLLSKRNIDDDIPLLSKRNDITNESIPLLSKSNEKPLFDVTSFSKKFIQNQLDNSLKTSINGAVSRSIPYTVITNDISQSSNQNYVQLATKRVGNELDKSLNESISLTLNLIMKQLDFGQAEKIEKPSLIEKSLNEALTSAVNQSVINSIYQICFV